MSRPAGYVEPTLTPTSSTYCASGGWRTPHRTPQHRLHEAGLQGGDHVGERTNRPIWTVSHTKELKASFGEVFRRLAPAGGLGVRLGDDRPGGFHLAGGEAGPRQQRS